MDDEKLNITNEPKDASKNEPTEMSDEEIKSLDGGSSYESPSVEVGDVPGPDKGILFIPVTVAANANVAINFNAAANANAAINANAVTNANLNVVANANAGFNANAAMNVNTID